MPVNLNHPITVGITLHDAENVPAQHHQELADALSCPVHNVTDLGGSSLPPGLQNLQFVVKRGKASWLSRVSAGARSASMSSEDMRSL